MCVCVCVHVLTHLLSLACADFSAVEQVERSKEFVQGLPEVNKEVIKCVMGLMVKVSGWRGGEGEGGEAGSGWRGQGTG